MFVESHESMNPLKNGVGDGAPSGFTFESSRTGHPPNKAHPKWVELLKPKERLQVSTEVWSDFVFLE